MVISTGSVVSGPSLFVMQPPWCDTGECVATVFYGLFGRFGGGSSPAWHCMNYYGSCMKYEER